MRLYYEVSRPDSTVPVLAELDFATLDTDAIPPILEEISRQIRMVFARLPQFNGVPIMPVSSDVQLYIHEIPEQFDTGLDEAQVLKAVDDLDA